MGFSGRISIEWCISMESVLLPVDGAWVAS